MKTRRFASLAAASALALTAALGGAFGGCGGSVDGTGGTAGDGGSGGGGDDFAACDAPGQCVLVAAACCGACGPTELADFVAVNQARAADFASAICPVPQPCPECASEPNPNLFTYCKQGRCVALDARTDAVSACEQTSDCVLRYGMGCCETTCQGTESEVTCVSVKGFQAIHTDLGCDSVACDACIPTYPMYTAPLCTDGHCEVGLLN